MSKQPDDQDLTDDELYGLNKAIVEAWTDLEKQAIEKVIARTQCMLGETSNNITLPFLNDRYNLNLKTRTVETEDGQQFYNLFLIGIMLHYLTYAQDLPLSGKLIGFRELWGGQEYYYAFNNRVLVPLIDNFGDNPELFIKAAEALAGEKMDKGEYGFKIPALPRVPVYVLLWTGDDEVDASANVLFDASANEHMETEALVWLSVAIVSGMKKIK